jgi:GrpB-like predicted nucleotidyltransferase (UPF0157 family)
MTDDARPWMIPSPRHRSELQSFSPYHFPKSFASRSTSLCPSIRTYCPWGIGRPSVALIVVASVIVIRALSRVEVQHYDRRWPDIYAAESAELLSHGDGMILELEHVGSTAVPGLRAKPIIDMMAAVSDLAAGHVLARLLGGRGYRLIETGMKNRLFLRRRSDLDGQVFHLHIVEQTTWADRKERLMRDYLIHHPAATKVYGDLKVRLAAQYAEDSLAYTKAKTAFIQHIVDEARAEHGLSRIDVWNE